jgi:hypothetical protein
MLSGNLGSARFESVPADIDSIVGVDGAIEGDDDSFFSKAVTTPKAIGDRARWEQNVPRKGGGGCTVGDGGDTARWGTKCSQ